ncbi:uncharacterized protein N7529_011630 [Penicillium soppii]|uniref:uncharacterized protein n=1 Tax=Penicillium soppii TaxID=69789 RepID=UPI0025487081|nr:uncharacterized protein N7529_011630 [Penicillium soppii]KAJ5852245.1 hypothetical protein N7529_011630 [Penicillium soppii]
MHYIPPFLSLSTSFRSRRSKSPSDASNTSSASSPPSSPTSTLHSQNFHPSKIHSHTFRDGESNQTTTTNVSRPRPASDIPLGHNASTHAVGVLPCAVLRGRSSMMVLRRRLSKIDMVLTEERSRCDEDSIERQGLGLMEPRPEQRGEVQQFVMGGILEVMEGRA